MASAAARIALESLLQERKLDNTLTSRQAPGRGEEAPRLATGLTLDAVLEGGLPRGQVSELVGPRSSGRTSAACAVMAGATGRGELVALVDTLDRFDPASGAAAGIDFSRLLWVRGDDVPLGRLSLAPDWEPSRPQPGRGRRSLAARALDRAIKALNLVLQSGGFGLVIIDLADVPLEAVRDLPFTTWLRVQRVVEGGDTTCLILADVPVARSTGGVSVRLRPAGADESGSAEARALASLAGRSKREYLDAEAFKTAVVASRRPFLPQTSPRRAAGCWDHGSRLGRFLGLSAEASVVQAHPVPGADRQVPLLFGDVHCSEN
jgi:hypothetical protein